MPVAISSTLLPESKSCGAMLRGAFDQFSRHVGNVDLLQGETAEERAALLDGVLECLDAAEDELSTIQQEKLLRSAQFGKCFLDGMDPVPEAAEAADATVEPAVSTASAASAASATSASAASAASAAPAAPAPAGRWQHPAACGTRRSVNRCRGRWPAGQRSQYRDISSLSSLHWLDMTSSVLRRMPR